MSVGTMFVRVAKSDRGCERFIAKQYAMLDVLMALRNDATGEAMKTACGEEDPLADLGAVASLPKRPRRHMFDEIADVADVTVKCEDDCEHQVKMLAEWRKAST
eukprot:7803760-Pyramimonas_sp.AAC.1